MQVSRLLTPTLLVAPSGRYIHIRDCKIKSLIFIYLCCCHERDYDAESERRRGVEEFYRVNHIGQTVDFVRKMREEYEKLNRTEMSIWECCELLNEFIDESDPDLDEPQIEHLLQTAEAIRKDYPDEDWLHLTGLIHGKLYSLIRFDHVKISFTGLMILCLVCM
jgi:hypothetical protein